jgi:hypothetical protein
MNKHFLSLVGVAAFAAITPSAEARDHCDRSGYGYRHSHSHYRPAVRVVYAQPVYHRHYDRSYCAPPVRVYHRSYDDGCRHGGVRGFIHRIFR